MAHVGKSVLRAVVTAAQPIAPNQYFPLLLTTIRCLILGGTPAEMCLCSWDELNLFKMIQPLLRI